MSEPGTSRENPIDIAIFGAGAAGAYTAYRLATTDPRQSRVLTELLESSDRDQLSIRLFERGARVGGRLWTYHFDGLEGVPADLGGMGFSRTQQNVFGLCSEVLPELDVGPFSPFNFVNIQFVRGRRFLYDQYWQYWSVPYQLTGQKQGNNPSTLVQNALELAIPGLRSRVDAVTGALQVDDLPKATEAMNELTAFLRQAELAATGEPVWQNGFWELIAGVAGAEAYSLVLDSGYLRSVYLNFNLYDMTLLFYLGMFPFYLPAADLDAVGWLISKPGTQKGFLLNQYILRTQATAPYSHIRSGYQELPKALIKRFEGGDGQLSRGSQLYELQRDESDPELIVLTVAPPGGEARARTLYARKVVLAMPKRSLELLDQHSVIFHRNPEFNRYLETVSSVPATKTFMSYEQPWWYTSTRSSRPS